MEATQESAKIRHDWYQTETHVYINVLCKNVKEEDFSVHYEPESFVVRRHQWVEEFENQELTVMRPRHFISFTKTAAELQFQIDMSFIQNEAKYNLKFMLLREINPSECRHKITSSKIEIKLKKKEGLRWEKLENDGSVDKSIKQASEKGPTYPSSSLKPKDWDKVVVDITKNDEDNPEGDAALNALFQKIYSEGSDEVRKAMNKSFVESAGTVLSTNWGEVKKEKVTMKPPDGMEFKKWDS